MASVNAPRSAAFRVKFGRQRFVLCWLSLDGSEVVIHFCHPYAPREGEKPVGAIPLWNLLEAFKIIPSPEVASIEVGQGPKLLCVASEWRTASGPYVVVFGDRASSAQVQFSVSGRRFDISRGAFSRFLLFAQESAAEFAASVLNT